MIKADQVTDGHQLVVRMRAGKLAVTCPCLLTVARTQDWQPYRINGQATERRTARRQRRVIEARTRFPAAEAVAAWRAWHEREGITL